MDGLDSVESRSVVPYRCSTCTRCFVATRDMVAGEILCVCGAPLIPSFFSSGLYQLKSPVAKDARATSPIGVPSPPPLPREPDLGYGASHGNAPGHEGPSGPADAPASST